MPSSCMGVERLPRFERPDGYEDLRKVRPLACARGRWPAQALPPLPRTPTFLCVDPGLTVLMCHA